MKDLQMQGYSRVAQALLGGAPGAVAPGGRQWGMGGIGTAQRVAMGGQKAVMQAPPKQRRGGSGSKNDDYGAGFGGGMYGGGGSWG